MCAWAPEPRFLETGGDALMLRYFLEQCLELDIYDRWADRIIIGRDFEKKVG